MGCQWYVPVLLVGGGHGIQGQVLHGLPILSIQEVSFFEMVLFGYELLGFYVVIIHRGVASGVPHEIPVQPLLGSYEH